MNEIPGLDLIDVLPAHAGMIPVRAAYNMGSAGCSPRMRG